MPIYEYVCESCGKSLEIMQKMGEVATECPACHKPALKKQISAPGFQLKGTGWYQTDFRGKDKKSGGSEESATPAPPCGAGTCGCH